MAKAKNSVNVTGSGERTKSEMTIVTFFLNIYRPASVSHLLSSPTLHFTIILTSFALFLTSRLPLLHQYDRRSENQPPLPTPLSPAETEPMLWSQIPKGFE